MEDNTLTILFMTKVGAMVGLGFGSLALGMLPLIVGGRCKTRDERVHSKVRRGVSSNCSSSTTSNDSSVTVESVRANSQGLLASLLLCFGGGVLLFTTFLHLAPEVRLSVDRHQTNGQLPSLGSLSLSELLFCTGFFLVYLVEEAVHAALMGHHESSETLLYRTVSVRRCNNNNNNNNNTNNNNQSNGSLNTTVSSMSVSTTTNWNNENNFDEKYDQSKKDKVLPAIFVLSSTPKDSELRKVTINRKYPAPAVPKIERTVKNKDKSIQGLLTVLALSFHAIFEGLAVGLEASVSSVIYLAAAIATHKLVISFCVGMELYVAGATCKRTFGYMSVFSMVTPIGIAVGLVLGYFKNDSDNLGATPTILQGMAAGTLLYVVFFEVLARERANEKSGLLQLAAIFVGFMLMLALQITTANLHSHGGHDHNHDADDHEHSH